VHTHREFALAAAVTLALSAACASNSQSNGGSSSGALTNLGPAMLQWSGSFRPSQQAAGDALAPRGRNSTTGTVVLRASTPTTLNATIDLNDVPASMNDAHWALIAGSCGSNAIPVMTVNEFPVMTVSSSRAHVKADISIALPTTGSYHVNVYRSNGADESDVLTCANLKLEPRTS
jgi:hypothetical protein